MSVASVPLLSTGLSLSPDARQKDSPEKIRDTASQFEALLIGQVLKNAKQEKSEGMMGDDEDDSSASTTDLANDFFARSLASKGGIGLAQVFANGLEKASLSNALGSNNSSPASPDTPPPAGIPTTG